MGGRLFWGFMCMIRLWFDYFFDDVLRGFGGLMIWGVAFEKYGELGLDRLEE